MTMTMTTPENYNGKNRQDKVAAHPPVCNKGGGRLFSDSKKGTPKTIPSSA